MAGKRREMDIMKLMMSDYEVHMDGDGADFLVLFKGPEGTLYEGGVWKVHVNLPKEYPYRSPSIGFKNRLFHPNVDEMSGSVCLDVINQTWSPMYDLLNIFDMFLPQLLSYPNASDPLNGEAASLMLQDTAKYEERVRQYVVKYASEEAMALSGKQRHESTSSASTALSGDSEDGPASDGSAAGDAVPPAANRESAMEVDETHVSSNNNKDDEGADSDDKGENKTNDDDDDDDDDELSSLSDSSDVDDQDKLVLDL